MRILVRIQHSDMLFGSSCLQASLSKQVSASATIARNGREEATHPMSSLLEMPSR